VYWYQIWINGQIHPACLEPEEDLEENPDQEFPLPSVPESVWSVVA